MRPVRPRKPQLARYTPTIVAVLAGDEGGVVASYENSVLCLEYQDRKIDCADTFVATVPRKHRARRRRLEPGPTQLVGVSGQDSCILLLLTYTEG
jgi:hypothetical protein